MDVEVRRIETTVHETGVGVADRTDVSYELGAVIDGAWVRFGSVTQSQVDVAKAAQPGSSAAPADPAGPTMADVTPTPAPQAQAVAAEQQAGEPAQGPTQAPANEAASSGGGTT